jgi:hypothetical protein
MTTKTTLVRLSETELELIAHWIWNIRDNHRTDPWSEQDELLADKLESAGFRLTIPNYPEQSK